MKDLVIYVATHKQVKKYTEDACYQMLHVGAANHENTYGYICDNTGINISEKNPMYCELTGLYWIWKNAEPCKYVGLCHYRRYPAKHASSYNPAKEILSGTEILQIISDYDVIMPKKLRKTEANSLCKNETDLEQCRSYQIIKKAIIKYSPQYEQDLKSVFMQPDMCFGNIFVMSWENFCDYCDWLFQLLFEVERELTMSGNEIPREYGFLSEWMLNAWVQHNKLNANYVPIVCTEEKHNLRFLLKVVKERLSTNNIKK